MIADVPPPDDTPEEPLIEYGEYEECDDEPVDLTQLKTRRDGPSGTIILNRPDVRNALSRLTIRELTQAFDEFHRTHGIRGIILAASGSTFCAGTDLKELSEGVGDPEFFKQWHDDAKQVQGLLEKMLQLPVPIIAAVHGPVCGLGVALALAADMVVAAPEATVSLPEPKVGLVATQTAPLLSFRLGAGSAARLLLSGEAMDGNEALRMGLFHEVVKSDLVWVRAQELCSSAAEGARESLLLTKQLVNETIGESLKTFQAIAAANAATARTTEAAAEGVAAFLEKRKPQW